MGTGQSEGSRNRAKSKDSAFDLPSLKTGFRISSFVLVLDSSGIDLSPSAKSGQLKDGFWLERTKLLTGILLVEYFSYLPPENRREDRDCRRLVFDLSPA